MRQLHPHWKKTPQRKERFIETQFTCEFSN